VNTFGYKQWGVLLMLAAGIGLSLVPIRNTEARLTQLQAELDQVVTGRERHIDPAELLGLMYNNQLHLFLIDVRTEADFNLFHIKDAIHKPIEAMSDNCCNKLAQEGVKVVMSNDEARANQAFTHLTANGVPNVYILAGGLNRWLDLFQPPSDKPLNRKSVHQRDERLHYRFDRAYGHQHPASLPPRAAAADRDFESKVRVVKPTAVEGGGCG
jgi:hypothetical protein